GNEAAFGQCPVALLGELGITEVTELDATLGMEGSGELATAGHTLGDPPLSLVMVRSTHATPVGGSPGRADQDAEAGFRALALARPAPTGQPSLRRTISVRRGCGSVVRWGREHRTR